MPEVSEPVSSHDAGHEAQGSRTASGPGRVLIAVYGVFALAATARAGFQIATSWSDAPLAFSLSAFSGVVYLLATFALTRTGPLWHRVATAAITVELIGVLTIGTFSVVARDFFPRPTVWSYYGAGYLLIPLVLPILGLRWLRRTRG